jgi:hypothetical protein
MAKTLAERIDKFKPCPEGREWLAKQRTPLQAWRNCARADWMLWLIGRSDNADAECKAIVLCACEIARTVLHFIPASDRRPLAAIVLAERWANGEAVTRAELSAACDIAWSAACGAARSAASAAACDAARSAARSVALKSYAAIVRRHFPKPPKRRDELP